MIWPQKAMGTAQSKLEDTDRKTAKQHRDQRLLESQQELFLPELVQCPNPFHPTSKPHLHLNCEAFGMVQAKVWNENTQEHKKLD